jgi:hypothetical protein
MLGASACERCGWSPIGAAPVSPTTDLGGADPFVGGDEAAPAFAPPPPPPPGYAAPPPPPPGSVAPQGVAKPVPPQGGSSGSGCLGVIVLVAVAALGIGIFAAARGSDVADIADDIRDDFDIPSGSDEGFDGDRVDGPPLVIGLATEVQTLGTGDVAVHRFDGTVGTVTIRAVGLEGFDPFIRVESADGDVLDEDDDGAGAGTDALLTIDLTDEPGAVVLVRHFSGRPGSYTVLAFEGDGTAPVTDGPELAVDAPAGGIVPGRDQVVSHRFVGTGGPVTISVAGVTGLDPIVTVLDAAGAVLARNDDFSAETGRDARVDLTVAAGVEVVVEVSGFGSSSGPYVITVEAAG